MKLRTLGFVSLVAASVGAHAQGTAPYPTLNTYYNEDFAEFSSILQTNQWYTLLGGTFNVSNALYGLRWNPTYKTDPNPNNPPAGVQLDYSGSWQYYTASQSYAYITLDQGAATFGTPNSGGGNGGPPPPILKSSPGQFEARSLRFGENGRRPVPSLFDLIDRATEPVTPRPLHGTKDRQQGGGGGGGGGVARIYPYIYVGPSGMASPFPATGNFYFETALEFTGHIGADGSGVEVRFWQDNTPVAGATDPPIVDGNPDLGAPNQEILRIWADATDGVPYLYLLGYYGSAYKVTTGGPTSMHVYRLEAVQNGSTYTYKVKIDGSIVMTGTSSIRPNSFWIGNPVYNWWTQGPDWQTMAVDYVRTGSM